MEVTCASSTPRASQLNLKTVSSPIIGARKGRFRGIAAKEPFGRQSPERSPSFTPGCGGRAGCSGLTPETGRRVTSEASVGPLVSIGGVRRQVGYPAMAVSVRRCRNFVRATLSSMEPRRRSWRLGCPYGTGATHSRLAEKTELARAVIAMTLST
jgi:hypothetical protein